MKTVSLAALLLAAALPACHSCPPTEARFWEVKDAATGASVYTVDTPGVGFEAIDAKFVDGNGAYAAVDRPGSKRSISEADWVAATHGATWGLTWCPIRKSCWARVNDR